MTLRTILSASVLAVALAATPTDELSTTACTDAGFASCDRHFPTQFMLLAPLRGWCYIGTLYQCNVLDA